jgi:hypothetical protein
VGVAQPARSRLKMHEVANPRFEIRNEFKVMENREPEKQKTRKLA